MSLTSLLRVSGFALLAPLVVACVVDTEHDSRHGGDTVPVSSSGPGPGVAPPADSGPLLVEVDTNQTMNAAPGDGVGVFTEYVKGGHWHLWWTCDTNIRAGAPSCPFEVKVTVASGGFANVTSEHFDKTDVLTSDAKQIHAVTVTSVAASGLAFDTDPGAIITVDAALEGVHDPKLFFFVQSGTVNGGFKGDLTNPLMLEGSTP